MPSFFNKSPSAEPINDVTAAEWERFWSHVDRRGNDDCWTWTAGKSHGYGQWWLREKVYIGAHRFAYRALVGAIPEGTQLDHLCRNRLCVNPRHLEAVTQAVNLRRGGHTKLRPEDVTEVYKLTEAGWTRRRIADEYGVRESTIVSIVRGKLWPDLYKTWPHASRYHRTVSPARNTRPKKLAPEDVENIRRRLRPNGHLTIKQAAIEYGVHWNTVASALRS